MLTLVEILIGIVVIVGVARYIIKGYSATGVLFVGGLVLLIASALMGHKVLPGDVKSTGYSATDIVEYSAHEPRRRPWHDDHDALRFRDLYDAHRRQ